MVERAPWARPAVALPADTEIQPERLGPLAKDAKKAITSEILLQKCDGPAGKFCPRSAKERIDLCLSLPACAFRTCLPSSGDRQAQTGALGDLCEKNPR